MTNTLTHMNPAHQSVARSICYALTLETPDAWQGLPVILRARLDERERGMMAYMSLRSMDADNAAKVAEAVLGNAGSPLPTLISSMDDARFWASLAARQELKAFALAAFEMMGQRDQIAFLDHVTERQVAA
jgi:hypothetical protein